jgi:hypothetical protein
VRCESVDRRGLIYHVGMRFLWTTPRQARSVRHAVAEYLAHLERLDRWRLM